MYPTVADRNTLYPLPLVLLIGCALISVGLGEAWRDGSSFMLSTSLLLRGLEAVDESMVVSDSASVSSEESNGSMYVGKLTHSSKSVMTARAGCMGEVNAVAIASKC